MASRNASFHEGGFAGALLAPLKLIFALTMTFIGILVVAWIVDWIFVFKVWPDGIDRLKGILAEDLARALDLAEWQGGVPGAVTETANFVYGMVFRVTGIHDMGMRFAEGAALSIPDTVVRNTYVANHEVIEAAMIGTQLLGLRMASLILVLPFCTLLYFVAGVDGWTQREIRRACGGRESGSLYHRAKYFQIVFLTFGVLVILLWPLSFDQRFVGIPIALTVAALARLQWAYYKKHL